MAIANKNGHSFLLLGVIDENGIAKTLARIGKRTDIDKDSENFYMHVKPIFQKTDARVTNEAMNRKKSESISYQAYNISLEQYKQFLEMIAQIEDDLKSHYKNKGDSVDHKAKEDLDAGIMCYVPDDQPGDKVTFSFKEIAGLTPEYTKSEEDEWENVVIKPDLNVVSLSNETNHLTLSNNCRTFARSIMEQIIGVGKKISGFFLSDLNYRTKLVNSQPDNQTFYVLPPLPACSENASDTKVRFILEKLYAKLENIPKMESSSEKTRKKFDAIKSLYKKIAGNFNQPTAEQLLTEIQKHYEDNKNSLQSHRKNGLAQFFGLATDTEKLFKHVIKTLEKDKAAEENNSLKPKK